MEPASAARARWGIVAAAGLLLASSVVLLNPRHQRDERRLLESSQLALRRALELDAQLESAADPAATMAQRDTAYHTASEGFAALLERAPDLPEAHLGTASLAWYRDHDLGEARRRIDMVIRRLEGRDAAQLARPRLGGQTGAQLLAEAYVERALYALVPSDDGELDAGATDAALRDIQRARALADSPELAQLEAGLARQGAALGPSDRPLDPSAFEPASR